MANYNSNYTGQEIDYNIARIADLTSYYSQYLGSQVYFDTTGVADDVSLGETTSYILKLLVVNDGSGTDLQLKFVKEQNS